MPSENVYERDAPQLAQQYESKSFELVHATSLPLIQQGPMLILDIGAGSGRDAAWFSDHGHQVIAIEPSVQLRQIGESLHPNSAIHWQQDTLPNLASLVGRTFNLIWLSAVWMHLDQSAREEAMARLSTLLRPGSRIMLSLRKGPSPEGRQLYEVPVAEVEWQARKHGLKVIQVDQSSDQLGRNGVSWDTVWLELPEIAG